MDGVWENGQERVFYLRIGSPAAMSSPEKQILASPRRWLPLRAWAAFALLAITAIVRAEGLHPQDGPHVDLRFDLRQDAFVADISMNLVFLDEVLPPHREQPDRLEMSELQGMEGELLTAMTRICRVTADGRPLTPRIDGLAMNDPDEALLPLFPISGMRGLRKIKFELLFPLAPPGGTAAGNAAPAEPSTVAIVWGAFPTDLLSTLDPKPTLVIAAELTAQGVRSQLTFSEKEPENVWHATRGGLDARLQAVPKPATAPTRRVSLVGVAILVLGAGFVVMNLRRGRAMRLAAGVAIASIGAVAAPFLPIARVSLALPLASAGRPLPTIDEAKAIFEPLHVNLYRAFDFAEESAVYDALARSVDGPLLEDLYLTIHRSLVIQEEGGAVSRVREVRRVQVDVDSIGLLPASTGHGAGDPLAEHSDELPGFLVTCRYQVDGRVTHWGHSHDRTNEYLARYTVVARESGWRIAEAEVLSQSRIDGASAPATGATPASPTKTPSKDPLLDL